MNKKLILLMAAAMIVFPYSCKKKLPNHGVNADLQKAFSFKAGSYWVYKDSVTGKEDSFCVKLHRLDIGTSATGGYTYDYITSTVQPAYLLNYADSNTIEYQISEYSLSMRFIVNEDLLHFHGGYDYDAIQFPFVNNAGPIQNVMVLENIAIRGNLFQGVARVFYPLLGDALYLKSGIGIVKMNLTDTEHYGARHTWELERWHVVQ